MTDKKTFQAPNPQFVPEDKIIRHSDLMDPPSREQMIEEAIRELRNGDERSESGLKFTFDALQALIYQDAKEKGWWEQDRNDGEAMMLIVTEIAEATEGLRKGNPPSEVLEGLSNVEEELADTIIRILDFAGGRGYKIGEAIIKKVAYNRSRPRKHNKEF